MTQTQDGTRTRTFSWSDPAVNAARLGRLGGLEMLRAIAAGELPPPPIMDTIGVDGMEIAEGRVTVLIHPQEYHYNPLGTVHGGLLPSVLDSAPGCAVHSPLPAGTGYTSLDLSVRFVRMVTADSGRLRCEGTVLARSRRTAVAEARLTDARGRLVAHATSTCLLLSTDSATG